MSYVYMKVLEETPDEYESGIAKLTAGKINEVYEKILTYVNEGDKILDLGCGPGTLAIACTKKGAEVTAIDFSEKMITFADQKSKEEGVSEKITFIHGNMTQLEILLPQKKFDLIVSTLAFSELRHLEQQIVFNQCWELLTEDGKIGFADEIIPDKFGYKRLKYSIKRFFYGVATYWKTKKTTRAVKRFRSRLEESGFDILQTERFIGDTFELIFAQRTPIRPSPRILSDKIMRGFRGRIRGLLCILRAGSVLIPMEPGLYIFGNPTNKSPVLVTANYQLTVGLVSSALQDQEVYLLVADSMGENVWCAARGDKFGNREVAEVIKATRIEELVEHTNLVLPQLSAGGVNHRELKSKLGWKGKFGPIYAKDIPKYLETGKKTVAQRTVSFSLKERIEMAIQQSFFLSKFFFFWIFLFGIAGKLILPTVSVFNIAILLFPLLWIVYIIFAFIFPFFPTASFLKRGILYGGLLIIPFAGIGASLGSIITIGQWTVLGFVLGTFLGMDYSGASPISKPTEIDNEYPTMIILLGSCLIIFLILVAIGLVVGA
ncbi:MAG: corrinoid protein-associated methyltransferase CpaM [Candidatus Hodarchaeales archaeon]